MVGLIRGYPLSHSTASISHRTAPLLRTGLVHRWQWPEPVLGLLGPGRLGGQAEVVVLGGHQSCRAAVPGSPLTGPTGSTGLGTPGRSPLAPLLVSILCGSINKYKSRRVPELSPVLPGRRGWGAGARLPRGAAESVPMPEGHTRLLARRSRRSRSLTTSAP